MEKLIEIRATMKYEGVDYNIQIVSNSPIQIEHIRKELEEEVSKSSKVYEVPVK